MTMAPGRTISAATVLNRRDHEGLSAWVTAPRSLVRTRACRHGRIRARRLLPKHQRQRLAEERRILDDYASDCQRR